MLEISISCCYMGFMNRRKFIQSLAAAIALPVAPVHLLRPAVAALPAATPMVTASAAAVATKARFWTIYMYGLHGNCTPATLSTMLNIPETQARGFLNNLVADGTIRHEALLRNSLTKAMRTEGTAPNSELQKRVDMKQEATARKAEEETRGDEQALVENNNPTEEEEGKSPEISQDERQETVSEETDTDVFDDGPEGDADVLANETEVVTIVDMDDLTQDFKAGNDGQKHTVLIPKVN